MFASLCRRVAFSCVPALFSALDCCWKKFQFLGLRSFFSVWLMRFYTDKVFWLSLPDLWKAKSRRQLCQTYFAIHRKSSHAHTHTHTNICNTSEASLSCAPPLPVGLIPFSLSSVNPRWNPCALQTQIAVRYDLMIINLMSSMLPPRSTMLLPVLAHVHAPRKRWDGSACIKPI